MKRKKIRTYRWGGQHKWTPIRTQLPNGLRYDNVIYNNANFQVEHFNGSFWNVVCVCLLHFSFKKHLNDKHKWLYTLPTKIMWLLKSFFFFKTNLGLLCFISWPQWWYARLSVSGEITVKNQKVWSSNRRLIFAKRYNTFFFIRTKCLDVAVELHSVAPSSYKLLPRQWRSWKSRTPPSPPQTLYV